jgi:hypothetical protein
VKAAEIILAVGALAEDVTRDQVAVGLNNAALSYGLAQYRAQVRPEGATGEARAVADACRELLAAAGITSPVKRSKEGRKPIERSSIRQSLGSGGLFAVACSVGGHPDGAEAVLSVLRGVANLECWAELLAARYQAQAMPRGPGADKNEALAQLIGTMEHLYMSAWVDWPSLRRSRAGGDWKVSEDGESVYCDRFPVGFLRLLCEVFPLIAARGFDIPETPAAIEKACRRWRADLEARDLKPFWHERQAALTK